MHPLGAIARYKACGDTLDKKNPKNGKQTDLENEIANILWNDRSKYSIQLN